MTNANTPLVSIIIPVYNAEKYLKETLQSALDQTWPNKEIIIVDDGSTDDSAAIVRSYNRPIIKLIQQKNQGASSAKQTGLSYAGGDFIQYLDADDILHPDKLTLQVNELINRPGFISIGRTAHFYLNDMSDQKLESNDFYLQFLNSPLHFLIKLYGGYDMKGGMIQPNAFLTPRNLIDEAGPWNTLLSPCADEDGEYFCRVILKSSGLIYQADALNYYRRTVAATSLSGLKSELSYANLIETLWLKHGYLLAYTNKPEDVPLIHNATYRCLDEVMIKLYFKYPLLAKKIDNYQSLLSPKLKPGTYKLGGNIINLVSEHMGWKTARFLQYYFAKLIR